MNQEDELAQNGIPMFGPNGTLLTQKQRETIAKKKGKCPQCGIQTHKVKRLGKTPLTNEDVYKGICIKHDTGSQLPPSVLIDYQARNPNVEDRGHSRFKAVAQTTRILTPRSKHHAGPSLSSSMTSSPTPQPRLVTHTSSPVIANPRSNSPRPSHRPSPIPQKTNELMSKKKGTFMTVEKVELQPLLRQIEDSIDQPSELASKLHLLRNLTGDKTGALTEVKAVMEKYHGNSKIMMLATGAMWSTFLQHENEGKDIVDNGCLDMILDSMRKPSTMEETISWYLGMIDALVMHDEYRRAFVEKGGIKSIIQVLGRHKKDATIFEWACRALYNLLGKEEEEVNDNINKIEKYDGISILISVMKVHLNKSVGQWWAMRLLFRILDHPDADVHRVLTKFNTNSLGSSVCKKILSKESTPVNLFLQTAEMLFLLGCNDSRQSGSTKECVSCLTKFIIDHPSDAKCIETCSKVLGILSRFDVEAKRQISMQRKALVVLIDNMIAEPSNLGLLEVGMTLFWTLSCDIASFDLSLIGRISQAMEVALQQDLDNDVRFKTAVCGCFANLFLAVTPEGGAPHIILQMIESFKGDPILEHQATRLSSTIFTKYPELMEQKFDTSRLLNDLCDATNVDKQISSANIIASIAASSSPIKEEFLESGAIDMASLTLLTVSSEHLAGRLLNLLCVLINGETHKSIQLPNEFVKAILHVMDTFTTLDKLSCTVIWNGMIVSMPDSKPLNCDGLCSMITSIIDSNSTDDSIIEDACGALWATMIREEHYATDISSVYQSLLGLCEQQRDITDHINDSLLYSLAGALTSVLNRMQDLTAQITEDEIDSMINLLDLVIEYDLENVPLMKKVMELILALSYLKRDAIIHFGVAVVVIDCMVEHEGDEGIQRMGCAILAVLASTENLQTILSIADTDGVDLLVSALATFKSLEININVCKALSHLSIDHESRMLISSQGGIFLLANAINNFRDEVEVLESACGALVNLSTDAEEQLLASSNVVGLVIRTMGEQITSPRLQEHALSLIQNISMRSRDAKRAIAQDNGIRAVISCIEEFMGSTSVLERAFTTLWSLAVLEENQEIIALEGGLGVIINGMMANLHSEKVQKQACGCLAVLSSLSSNKTMIRDLGGLDAIVYAMWTHYKSEEFLIEACRALSELAVNVQTNEVMICSEGEVNAIIACMKRFPSSERLQEHSCVAMRNFTLSPDNVRLMKNQSDEIVLLMNEAASSFPDSCGNRATQVIENLYANIF